MRIFPPSGNTQEIRSIYSHYGSLDISDYDFRTPLHVAVSLGKLDMVTFLLSLNVPVSPVDRWGMTPLWSAVCDGKKDIAQVLRSRGGEIKQSNQTVASPLLSPISTGFLIHAPGCRLLVLPGQRSLQCPAAFAGS